MAAIEAGFKTLAAEGIPRKAGFTNQDDRLPSFFYKELLPPHNKVFVISNEEVDSTFDF